MTKKKNELIQLDGETSLTPAELSSRVSAILTPPVLDEGDFMSEEAAEKLEYLRVFQPTSNVENYAGGKHEGISMGEFYLPDGSLLDGVNRFSNKIAGIPLAVWESRAFFDDSERLCSSQNAKTPVHTRFSTSCAFCPKKVYVKGSKEARCKASLNVLFQDARFSRKPYVVTFKGTQYMLGKGFINDCKKHGLGSVAAKIGTTKAKGETNYSFIVENLTGISGDIQESIGPSLTQVKTYWCGVVGKMLKDYDLYTKAQLAGESQAAPPSEMQNVPEDLEIDEDLI